MNDQIKRDLLSQLLYEAQSYRKFEDIEKLVEGGSDLSMIPLQPLYLSLQTTSKDQVALILPKLSSEQRQALRDIDLWQKDELDPKNTLYWLEVYSKCPDDEIVLEYAKSEDFLLTLKSQFNVQTFDVEDPIYPDDDNYFLTEDNLLLIHYREEFNLVTELKEIIRRLYADLGVENAYAFLFKMVVDSYPLMEEHQYQEKKERLREYGFIDYYEALEFNTHFSSLSQIEDFIKGKKARTGNLDSNSINQGLHSTTLIPYQLGMESLKDALEKIKDEKRQHFLQFSFIRLVNGKMTLEDAFKNGSTAIARIGNQTRQCLELGFEFISSQVDRSQFLFEKFDFQDLYKIGNSLIQITRRKIKKALSQTPFEQNDFSYFLGLYWNSFIENSEEDVAKYKFDGSSKALEIRDMNSYFLWNDATDTLVISLPFIQTFFLSLEKLKADSLLNDQFYLNYEVENIDFEAIIISSLINFVGGHYQESNAGKMGVTISELKSFYKQFFNKRGDEYLIKGEEDPILREKTSQFIEKFGLERIPKFDKYIYQIMLEQLNGYEVDNMDEEDFRHVGGPILLNYIKN
jgi:hypothetical protein